MAVTKKPPTLVVLQLTGGNDTLNTVIPYGNPLYYDNRPNVRVERGGRPEDRRPVRLPSQHGGDQAVLGRGQDGDDQRRRLPGPELLALPLDGHLVHRRAETIATDGWLGKMVRELDPKAENVLTAVNFGRGLPRALSLAGVPVASVAQLDSYGLLTSLASVDQRNSALEVFSCMYDDGFNDDMVTKPIQHASAADPMSQVHALHGPDRAGRPEGRRDPEHGHRQVHLDGRVPEHADRREPEGHRPGEAGRPRDAGLLHGARQLRHPRQPAWRRTRCSGRTSRRRWRRSSPTCASTTRPTTSSC